MRLKKILSLLLAMTMLFSCVGITAMAEETISENVAEIEDTEYATLEDALNAAKEGDTINLKAGEHELVNDSFSEGRYWLPENLTIIGEDGAVVTNGPAISAKSITIDNVDFINPVNSGYNSGLVFHLSGDSAIKNSEIDGYWGGSYYSTASGNLLIEKCDVYGAVYGLHIAEGSAVVDVVDSKISGWNTYGSEISATFDNCEFAGNGSYAFLGFYNDVTIKNCSFTPDMKIASQTGKEIDITLNKCTVTDGTSIVNLIDASSITTSNITVDGVSLNSPTPEETPVAQIGDTPYATLEEAVADIKQDGSDTTIEILTDIETSESIEFKYGTGDVIFTADHPVTVKQTSLATDWAMVDAKDTKFVIDENVTFEIYDNASGMYLYYGPSIEIKGSVIGGQNWGTLYLFKGDHKVTETGKIGVGRIQTAYNTLDVEGEIDTNYLLVEGATFVADGAKVDAGVIYDNNNGGQRWGASEFVIKNGSEVTTNKLALSYADTELTIDTSSLITATEIVGSGKIVIDASEFEGEAVTLIKADMSGFTGEIEVINNSYAEYKIEDSKLVLVEKAPELPTATVTKHYENKDLAFALNFKADSVTAEQLAYYGDWYADFELTVNKDVTFNANGNADGYLCGQYDEWSENWVYVPFEDVTLEANSSLKIMEYASKLMGKPGLKYTYKEVYEVVNDFNCGVFFDEEFLAANPDLEVTLELRMYNPKNESESYAIGDLREFVAEDFEIPELPTATVAEVENEDLAFALNFKADDVTEKQLAYYGDWFADFELKINKDVVFNANGGANGYLSGQYNAWSENWVNVPFENVTVKAGESLKIMEYASKLMGKPGLKYTYKDVYEFVKDFNCGVFFEEDFLKANPDLEVTLELRMYNPNDESESQTIGKTYTYDAADFAIEYVASIGEEKYTSLEDAIAAAQAGDTITLLSDIERTSKLVIPAGKEIVLDLAGKTVSGSANTSEDSLVFVENTALLTVKDSVGDGKLTIKPGTSNVGYVVDLEGKLILESGTIEMTDSWSIGFAVDVRPNSWGSEYTEGTSFVMNGGKIVSGDGAVRVTSSSASGHENVSAAFKMVGGDIDAVYDGIFIQHTGDGTTTGGHDLSVSVEGGKITSTYAPIRIYGTSVINPVELKISGGTFEYTGNEGTTGWLVEGFLKGTDAVVADAEIVISGGLFDGDVSDYCVDGLVAEKNADGKYAIVEKAKLFKIAGRKVNLGNSLAMKFFITKTDLNGTDYYAIVEHDTPNGVRTTKIDYSGWVSEGAYMVVVYNGIAAKEMADKLHVTIYNSDKERVSETYDQSMRDYALGYLKAYDGTNNVWLPAMVDMLNYGAAAQLSFKYNTDDLATVGAEKYQHYASEDVVLEKDIVVTDKGKGSFLTLESNIMYNAVFEGVKKGMYAKVQFTDHYGKRIYDYKVEADEIKVYNEKYDYYKVVVDELVIADAAQVITVTLYDENGNAIGSITESINGYLYRANETYPNDKLYMSLAKFSASAKNALQ